MHSSSSSSSSEISSTFPSLTESPLDSLEGFSGGLDVKEREKVDESSTLVKKLKEASQDPKNYLILGGLAIYKGRVKDYQKVRENLYKKVKTLLKVKEDEVIPVSEHFANFVNLGGTSASRQNFIEIKEKSYKLDELTKILEITKRVGGNFQSVDRDEPTIASIGAAFADSTRKFLQKYPAASKLKDLGDLGFTNSFYCSGLRRIDYAKIYFGLLSLEHKWDSRNSRLGKPTRFSERMFFYCTLVLNIPPKVFDEVAQDFKKAYGLS